MTQLEKIGKNIRALREDFGIDQGQLADKLGVSRKTVSAWENGRSCPRMGVVEQLKQIYGCSIEDIINEYEYKNRYPMFDIMEHFNSSMPKTEPKEEPKPESKTEAENILTPQEQRLFKIYKKLSEESKAKLLSCAIDLLED